MTIKNCKYTYFYIHDHLGSTSMVFDTDGNISQSATYVPYGEIFVEERNGAWNSPYLFNSKELDEETGLYYYGARYLNPTNGVWLSVDSLFVKYVGMSPYQYCHNNPINRVDIDGRFDTEDEATQFIWDNEINGRVTQRSDGTYEIYDELSRETYYHDSQGTLNTDLPEFTVEAKRGKSKATEPTFFYKVANGYVNMMERGDNWANEFGAAIGNCLFYSDAYSLYFGVSAFLGGGVSGSIEIGYMKGEGNGWFFAYSRGVGTGLDLSLGAGGGNFKLFRYTTNDH